MGEVGEVGASAKGKLAARAEYAMASLGFVSGVGSLRSFNGGRASCGTVVCRVRTGQRVEIVDSRGESRMRIADRNLLASAKKFFDDFDEAPRSGGDFETFPCSSGVCYVTNNGLTFRMEIQEPPKRDSFEITGQEPIEAMKKIAKAESTSAC